ncbi:MAG: Gfo/Idh/MocA family oxidoreductase [Anaerolineae bacterium]|nr:Gfo/Idh/MocA family oxidoreductase [Anaerolineae bacterium]
MSKLRLAVLGTGYIARIHAEAARSQADVELVAVVNHHEDSMRPFAAQFGIPRQYTSLDDLIAEGGVDAISINSPNYLHAPQSIRALQAGIHVMVEKPMAMNAREARQMMNASELSGAKLMVAHCWRFDDEVRWLKQQLDEDRIGPIVRTKGSGVHVYWGPSGWFTEARYAGGGALADMGIHAIDTARFLLGDPQPVEVYADIRTEYGDYDVDDTGVILITWDTGATSLIESGWWQPHTDGPEASTQIYGKRGFARLFPTYLTVPDPLEQRVVRIESGFPETRDPHCPQRMYDTQLAYFADCIQQDRTPVPGGIEGWINLKIVDAAYESSRTQKVVDL